MRQQRVCRSLHQEDVQRQHRVERGAAQIRVLRRNAERLCKQKPRGCLKRKSARRRSRAPAQQRACRPTTVKPMPSMLIVTPLVSEWMTWRKRCQTPQGDATAALASSTVSAHWAPRACERGGASSGWSTPLRSRSPKRR